MPSRLLLLKSGWLSMDNGSGRCTKVAESDSDGLDFLVKFYWS
jgi:hypothetical protein